VLDAGVFVLAARAHRPALSRIAEARAQGLLFICAHTYAEFYRGGATSARESRLLNQWRPEVLEIRRPDGRLAGELLAVTGRDRELAMDALLVACASLNFIDRIITGDPQHFRELRAALPRTAHSAIAIEHIA
jgi:predicted nucleic acid-binding protein